MKIVNNKIIRAERQDPFHIAQREERQIRANIINQCQVLFTCNPYSRYAFSFSFHFFIFFISCKIHNTIPIYFRLQIRELNYRSNKVDFTGSMSSSLGNPCSALRAPVSDGQRDRILRILVFGSSFPRSFSLQSCRLLVPYEPCHPFSSLSLLLFILFILCKIH